MDHDNNPNDDGEGRAFHTETFVFTGNGGPAFLQSVQNLMNRMIRGQPSQPQPEPQEPPVQQEQQEQPQQPQSDDTDMSATDDPPVPDLPSNDNDHEMPDVEPLLPNGEAPPEARPMRPLPRPHAHFHAHTPGGIIDLFTFNVGSPPPPPPPGTATFTFNLGPDVLAGFEAFFLGGVPKDREPDSERAKVLVKGMEIVPEGLVRRLERAGGVPGGQGSEENAGCAVCWGPLLDEVEPGEWDTAKEREDKAKMSADGKEQEHHEDDHELRHRIVSLPCAHVYHAECLLPWFSRNTTCPTCRFDIDPESLTWTPRPPPNEPPPPPPHPNDEVPADEDARLFGPPPPAEQPQDAPLPQPDAEQQRRANVAEAARLNAFMNSIIRAVPFASLHPEHPAPPNQPPDQLPNQNQFQPQPPLQSQPQPPNLAEPPMPGPPPPPPSLVLPPIFPFRMPMFVVPQLHQPGAPNPPGVNLPDAPPPFNMPNFPFQSHAIPAPNIFHGHPHPPHSAPPPRNERKKWTPPEPVGKTLRQRVEEKERELGLRCDDMVCGVAPSDEDPIPAASTSEARTKRINIRAAYDAHGKACEHSFHPACLVTSARVAGVTGIEDGVIQEGELQVACPACRAVGSLSRAEWDQGVQASEAEMA